jgi:hypothetical protein
MNKEQKEILDNFLSQASPEEALELKKLLNKRKQNIGISSVNITENAKKMAKDLQESMGLTQNNVKKMARDLVVEMALQYDPNMSMTEIEKLIDEMVPQEDPNKKKLPKEMILQMARHIIEYNTGTIDKSLLHQLPENWIERYLASFPSDIQRVVHGYLQNKISLEECWTAVKALA